MRRWFAVVLLIGLGAVAACDDDHSCPVKYEEPGVQRYSLGILRETWTIASPPFNPDLLEPLPSRGLFDPALNWYNPYVQFEMTDVYDTVVGNPADNRLHVLVLRFDPRTSPLFDSVLQSQQTVWGGIMRGLPRALWDQTLASAIEIRMAARTINDNGTAGSSENLGVLHVDLGRISEDVNLDGILNTEDLNLNGLLEDLEDVGLDGVADEFEDINGDGTPDYDPDTLPDPAGDNWYFSSDQWEVTEFLNGTEGNLSDFLLGRPDTEEIGGSSGFDVANAYYAFAIDLSDPGDHVIAGDERVSQRDPSLTWRTYRIPLWSDYTRVDIDGVSDSTYIQFVRLWIDNAGQAMEVYIARQDLVFDPPEEPNTE